MQCFFTAFLAQRGELSLSTLFIKMSPILIFLPSKLIERCLYYCPSADYSNYFAPLLYLQDNVYMLEETYSNSSWNGLVSCVSYFRLSSKKMSLNSLKDNLLFRTPWALIAYSISSSVISKRPRRRNTQRRFAFEMLFLSSMSNCLKSVHSSSSVKNFQHDSVADKNSEQLILWLPTQSNSSIISKTYSFLKFNP